MARGELSFGDLPVVCLQKNAVMFLDACVIEVDSFEAADVTDDLAQVEKFESVQAGEVAGTQE